MRSVFSLQFLLNAVKAFYERNLFERIVIYLFASSLFVKVVFVLIMGQWSFLQSQNFQWVFFGLITFDYLISIKKFINFKVKINFLSLWAVLILIMILQGLFVGIVSRNAIFELFNDTVPLLIIAFNILRFQSVTEYKPIDFEFLLRICTVLALCTTFVGLAAQLIGRFAEPSIGGASVYLPLFIASLFTIKPYPKWVLVSVIVMIGLSISDFNRTSIVFLGGMVGLYLLITLIKKPVKGLIIGILILSLCTVGWMSLSENSKTYVRIVGLTKIDFSERKGSVGERQAEMDAVQNKIDRTGLAAQWLGLGFGGVYEVQFTHTVMENYGHAHYSWVWFNLRFGRLGFIYLAVMLLVLSANAYIGYKSNTKQGFFITCLCIQSLLYCITYVNAVFLMSGLQFFLIKNVEDAGLKNPSSESNT